MNILIHVGRRAQSFTFLSFMEDFYQDIERVSSFVGTLGNTLSWNISLKEFVF